MPKKRGRPRKWPPIVKKQVTKSAAVPFDTLMKYNLRDRELVFTKIFDQQENVSSYSTEGMDPGNTPYLPEISVEKRTKENERLPSINELLSTPMHPNHEQIHVANILLSFASGRIDQ